MTRVLLDRRLRRERDQEGAHRRLVADLGLDGLEHLVVGEHPVRASVLREDGRRHVAEAHLVESLLEFQLVQLAGPVLVVLAEQICDSATRLARGGAEGVVQE